MKQNSQQHPQHSVTSTPQVPPSAHFQARPVQTTDAGIPATPGAPVLEPIVPDMRSHPNCANRWARVKPFSKINLVVIILSLLLTVAVVACLILAINGYSSGIALVDTSEKLKTANDTIAKLEETKETMKAMLERKDANYKALEEQNNAELYKASFLDTQIAIIVPSLGKTYHTLDCPYLPETFLFSATNIANAELEGYTPCHKCQ